MAVADFVGKDGNLGQAVQAQAAAAAPVLTTRDKPYGISGMALPIALGVSVPLVSIFIVLIILWRRNVRKQRLEDAKDPHRDLDFGLGDTPMGDGKKKSRKSFLMGGDKGNHRTNQLSMDMNLSSPYLLPPQAHASHDSLARDYSKEYDPYQIVNSEVGSIRSFGKESQHKSGPVRQGSFPKSSLSSHEKPNAFATPTAPEPVHRSSTPNDSNAPVYPIKPLVAERDTVFGDDSQKNIQEPPVAVAKNPTDRIASPPIDDKFDFGLPPTDNRNTGDRSLSPSGGPAIDITLAQPLSPIDDLMFTTANSSPQPNAHASPMLSQAPQAQPTTATPGARESQGSFYDDQPQTQITDYYEDYSDYGRGRSTSRQSIDDVKPQPRQQPGGLGVPQQDSKRLSVGFRPLPPDDALDSEDPEYRANRIRSFYKEYFDDSKEAQPPMPTAPVQRAAAPQYYEDYDQSYLGDGAAFFDPDSNAFVMPGAQPVHRRAMTPPPAGRRGGPGPGPRGAPRSASRGPRPHGPHGSLGGMSLPGGPRSQSAWGPHPGSRPGSRPGSSASRSRKNLPPPAALRTLPTPSKLTDDSLALMTATDFAPPDAFGERARGRSQSPLGERRAYQPKVPSASPLVNSYDELNALPSPHLLRKSSTFTGLDFLPPKKFKDQDNQSDAGSIRSNRSGMSAQAAHAIRSGAGRISRLPGDQVFTQQALASELKPQWGMRQ